MSVGRRSSEGRGAPPSVREIAARQRRARLLQACLLLACALLLGLVILTRLG